MLQEYIIYNINGYFRYFKWNDMLLVLKEAQHIFIEYKLRNSDKRSSI